MVAGGVLRALPHWFARSPGEIGRAGNNQAGGSEEEDSFRLGLVEAANPTRSHVEEGHDELPPSDAVKEPCGQDGRSDEVDE
jgi:hypothetical protein